MLRLRIQKTNREWLLVVVFYLLMLQNPLSDTLVVVKYTDELCAVLGCAVFLYTVLRSGKIRIKKSSAKLCFFLLVFALSGLSGNIIYKYQPVSVVLTDLLVNLKFFMSILTGYLLFSYCGSERCRGTLLRHVHFSAVVFFIFLILDQLFHIFPSPEVRYGLRVSPLFYKHPTHLAGTMVFLLAIMMMFQDARNRKYIAMCLLILCFTLRGKALAGAAAYVLIYYFLILQRKRLKMWHIALFAIVALVIGWDQLQFYYVDLGGRSARSVMTQTSFVIMKDYFPIGTGFGTYASQSAGDFYSPVYVKYGFLDIYEVSNTGGAFFSDTFWPIIIGQTGAIGLCAYLASLLLLYLRIFRIRKVNTPAYAMGIFVLIYLMISSTSEPAFNNVIANPLAVALGYIISQEKHGVIHVVNNPFSEGNV